MAKELITSDLTLKSLSKPKDKTFRVSDGKGLYLLVNPDASKWWRLDYTINGKRKTLSLGVYPEVTLSSARDKAAEARKQVADSIDPSDLRKENKAKEEQQKEVKKLTDAGLPVLDSFEYIAREWHKNQLPKWTGGHAETVLTRLENNAFPWIGNRPINQIEPPELLTVFRRIEERGAGETVHRVKQYCGQVFRYGVATGKCNRDQTADLRGALKATKESHHASITDVKQIGELMESA